MAETTASETPISMPADEAEPRKKNQKIKLTYWNSNGEQLSQPFGATAVKVEVPSENFVLDLAFADLPAEIFNAAAAFGLNTVLRNEVNTSVDEAQGVQDLTARVEGFKSGIWRPQGEGNGTAEPLIITAMCRAVAEAKWPDEKIAERREAWMAHYHSLDKKGKAAQTEEWKGKAAVKAAFEAIKAERAAERAQLAKKGKKKGESLDDL